MKGYIFKIKNVQLLLAVKFKVFWYFFKCNRKTKNLEI